MVDSASLPSVGLRIASVVTSLLRINRINRIHRIHGMVCMAALSVASALVCARTAVAQNAPGGGDAGQSLASKADSYLQYPLAKLKKAVPALETLKADENQEELPVLLGSVAEAIGNVIPRLPDLISREEVYRSQHAAGLAAPQQIASLAVRGANGPQSATTITPQGVRGQEFRYLILCRHIDTGITVEESRTDSKGQPVKSVSGGKNPLGSGFAYQWLLFSGANQPEFDFRYLGEQDVDGKKTFAIAFAQAPERVKMPAVFQSEGEQAQYFYQGVLWVDQATFNIVLLHTDLLAPVPRLRLAGLTTELHFKSAEIHNRGESFWLPSQVRMVIEQGKSEIVEVHEYTDYHLYRSTATIVPAP
jgi:hypothetical protein